MKRAMQVMRCGMCAMLFAAGVSARAAVDGETFRASGGEAWFQTSNYSSLERGPWKGGKVPSDGGTAYFVTPGTIKLEPTAGLQLGAIEVRSGATANLFTRGLTMVGDNPYIQAAYNSVFQIDSTVPLSGTGANTLTLKSAPGYGFGKFNLYADLPNFVLLDLDSGALDVYRTGTGQTLLTTGSVRLSGANLTYVASMASAGDASASIATGSGSSFTFAPGPGRLRVALDSKATSATLTVGPIVREGHAAAEIAGPVDGDNKLGESVFVKTTTAPTLVNGFVGPWLVTKGQNGDSQEGADHVDFLTYDADKGFIPATALYASDFGDPNSVVSKTGNITVDADTHVQGLRIVSIGGEPSLSLNATLTVGDGAHPAAVLLNYRGGGNNPFQLTGSGALDFGTSEGLVWCAPNMTDNRRIVKLNVPIRGSNGITFAAPLQTAGRAPIIQNVRSGVAAWSGPLHLRNVRYQATTQDTLPSPDVYVDGRGLVRGAQVTIGTAAFTNHFHIAGNGLQDSTDRSGAIQGIGTLNGPVTLVHDATLFAYADSTGTFTVNGPIDGHGTLTLRGENNNYRFRLAAANTYDGDTEIVSTMVTLDADGTFGTGPVKMDADSSIRLAGVSKMISNAISGLGTVWLAASSVGAPATNAFGTLAFDGNSAVGVAGVSSYTSADTTLAAVKGRGTINGTKLTVDSDADGEFHATLSGSAALVKDGTGELSLFADVASSGGVTVQGGTLRTAGRLEAPFKDSLAFHLDATEPSTFKYADDGTITNWASTVGNVAFKSAGGVFTGPRRSATGWNDLPVVTFDAGASNRLYSSAAVAPRTLFFVVRPRPDSMVTCGGLFGQAGVDDNGVRAATHLAGGVWTWDSSVGHQTFDSNGAYVIDGGQAGYREIYFNKPQVIVAEKTNDTARALSFTAGLGGYCNTATAVAYDRNFDGDIAEVVAYDRILSESERKRVENYLGRKWKDGAFYENGEEVSLGTGALTLAGDGVLDLAGTDVTVGGLAGTGLITNSSDRAASLTVTGTSSFAGEVRGNVALSVAGGAMATVLSEEAALSAAGNVTLGVYNPQVPADGLIWWMDASDAATVTTNADGKVTRWNSRGSAETYFAPDGNLPAPIYAPAGHANALGAKPGVWFDGTGRTRLTSSEAKSVKTTFLVWSTSDGTSDGKFRGIYGYQNVDAGIRYWTDHGLSICHTSCPFSEVDGYFLDGIRPTLGGNYSIPLSLIPVETIHVLSVVAGEGRTAPAKKYVFGSYHASGDRCFIGWIYEAIAYDRCLPDAERRQVENYLMAKWQGTGGIVANATVGGNVTVASGATLTAAAGSPLAVGTLSGAGAISGNVSADGFEVTVKPNGTVDKLTVNGTVTFNAGAHLQVNDFNYLVNGNYETFLDATGNVGTFATSNLEKPYGWTLRNGHGQVYQANGFTLIFR